MKTDEQNLTIEELDELCRLYMDCELSVLEEKELEYILSTTSLTSDTIADVRALMNVQVKTTPEKAIRKKGRWRRNPFIGVAASIAVILFGTLFFAKDRILNPVQSDPNALITAYSCGKRLNANEAAEATNLAMAKADSLMQYASLTENENMIRANAILRETIR